MNEITNFGLKSDKKEVGKSTFGFVEEGKVIRNAFGANKERIIGEVNSTEEESLQYFEEKFAKLEEEVNEIAEKIGQQDNKGSFLTKVNHLKTSLPEFDGLGDFVALDEKLDKMLSELNLYIEQNRHKNLQIKTALLEQLKPIAASHEWKTASAQVKEIQHKWIKTGAVAEDKREEIEGEYKVLVDDFYSRRNAFYDDLNKMMEEREADYQDFIQSAKSLLTITELEKLRPAIHQKQEEWKELGKIKPSKHSEFWSQFQELIKAALKEARKKAKKVSGGNVKQQLEKLKAFADRLNAANEEVIPEIDLKEVKEQWRFFQKIKHKEAFELKHTIHFAIEMLAEKQFINALVDKRKGDRKDLKLRYKISRDLLERDRRELHTFQENLGKFNMAEGLDNMLTKKLRQQEQKVEVKKSILEQIKSQSS